MKVFNVFMTAGFNFQHIIMLVPFISYIFTAFVCFFNMMHQITCYLEPLPVKTQVAKQHSILDTRSA